MTLCHCGLGIALTQEYHIQLAQIPCSHCNAKLFEIDSLLPLHRRIASDLVLALQCRIVWDRFLVSLQRRIIRNRPRALESLREQRPLVYSGAAPVSIHI